MISQIPQARRGRFVGVSLRPLKERGSRGTHREGKGWEWGWVGERERGRIPHRRGINSHHMYTYRFPSYPPISSTVCVPRFSLYYRASRDTPIRHLRIPQSLSRAHTHAVHGAGSVGNQSLRCERERLAKLVCAGRLHLGCTGYPLRPPRRLLDLCAASRACSYFAAHLMIDSVSR